MNVITITKQGVPHTPILIEDDTTAQATFNNIAEELAGDDVSEIKLHTDSQIEDLNSLIKYKGVEVHWFEGVEISKYVNQNNDCWKCNQDMGHDTSMCPHCLTSQ